MIADLSPYASPDGFAEHASVTNPRQKSTRYFFLPLRSFDCPDPCKYAFTSGKKNSPSYRLFRRFNIRAFILSRSSNKSKSLYVVVSEEGWKGAVGGRCCVRSGGGMEGLAMKGSIR